MMKKVKLKSKTISGLKVRTTNEAEMNPQTAKIGHMWSKFFEKIAPTLDENVYIYGVYTNYESDAYGEFDVIAGYDMKNEELETVKIHEGNYLCFEAKGEMPQAVIETWGKIWAYFLDENCSEKRVFKSDFELYLGQDKAEIYIGVE